MSPDALNHVRPEWMEAVDAAWYDWRFGLAVVLPIAMFFAGALFEIRALITYPIAVLVCWFFASWGIGNVTDVMFDNAVTEAEMGIAAADTGRVFAPVFSIPPLAVIYTLVALALGEFQLLALRGFLRWFKKRAAIGVVEE